jgi:hypothetical protein
LQGDSRRIYSKIKFSLELRLLATIAVMHFFEISSSEITVAATDEVFIGGINKKIHEVMLCIKVIGFKLTIMMLLET